MSACSVKCSNFYCVPWEYVCDNKWDCPFDSDENLCTNHKRCDQMFQCRGFHQLCVHLGQICDGTNNCPFSDDEFLCILKKVKCLPECQCLALAISCLGANVTLRFVSLPFISVSIVFSSFFSLNVLKEFPEALHVSVPGNNIVDICAELSQNSLVMIDAAYNSVIHIEKQCFHDMPELAVIKLNDNKIVVIETESFVNLPQLRYVNLSMNHVDTFVHFFTLGCFQLKMLSIMNNKIGDIDENALLNMAIDVVETEDYHMCCISHSDSTCLADRPWYISCTDLLPSDAIKAVFVLMSLVIFVPNCISMILHVASYKTNKSFSVAVISVNLTDILCGIYLGTIWITDIKQKGKFMAIEVMWRSGAACFAAFCISLTCSMLTPLVILFVALSRLMIVLYPVDTKFKRVKFTVKCLVAIFLSAMLLCMALTLAAKFMEGSIPFSLCLAFVDPSNSVMLLKLITMFIAVLQVSASVAILSAHFILVKSKKNPKRMSENQMMLLIQCSSYN